MEIARHKLRLCADLEHEGYMKDLNKGLGGPGWRHMSGTEFQARMRWHQAWIDLGTKVPHAYAQEDRYAF